MKLSRRLPLTESGGSQPSSQVPSFPRFLSQRVSCPTHKPRSLPEPGRSSPAHVPLNSLPRRVPTATILAQASTFLLAPCPASRPPSPSLLFRARACCCQGSLPQDKPGHTHPWLETPWQLLLTFLSAWPAGPSQSSQPPASFPTKLQPSHVHCRRSPWRARPLGSLSAGSSSCWTSSSSPRPVSLCDALQNPPPNSRAGTGAPPQPMLSFPLSFAAPGLLSGSNLQSL